MILRKNIVLTMFLLLLLGLTSCGVPNVKGEDELEEDLANTVSLFQTDVDISSLKIIKRQTNKSEMSDTVYVEINGTGSYYECTTSFIMNYSLYDQGWLLDSATRWYDGTWHGQPFAGVPEPIIMENAVPNDSRYYQNEFWTSNLLEINDQIVDKEAGTSTVHYKYAIGGTYGYYLVNDCALYEFDSESFCYYPLPTDISDHSNVQLILSDSIIGVTFSYDNTPSSGSSVNGKFEITIDSIDGNYITGHGSYIGLRAGREYCGDGTFDFDGTIETFKRETTAGYDYLANVHIGDVNPDDSLMVDIWFTLDPREGIDFISGDLR